MDLLADFENGLERLLEVATEQKRHYIDIWLDAIKDDDQYSKFITSRLDGTCSWVLSHPTYTAWESQDSDKSIAKLLWIHGAAGFGKTVLAASLIQHIGMSSRSLAHCFSASHVQSNHELDGIVRTWAAQLIRKDEAILELANQMRRKQNSRRASRADVWTLLKRIAIEIQSGVLVLDGLDEFQSADDRRIHFLGDLKKAVQGTGFRVLITSRNEFDIESQLRPSTTEASKYRILDFKISRNDLKDDIDLVSQSIVTRRLPKQPESLRRELAMEMAERCDGQFLWLKLQQDQLRDSKSPKALRHIVQAMPERLHSIYARSWSDIQALEEPDRGRAVDTLRWLTFAYEPLIVQELAEALIISLKSNTVPFSEDDLPQNIDDEYIDGEIKNLCGSLVELEIDSSSPDPAFSTVRLVHASVTEFLIEKLPVPSLIKSVPAQDRPSTAQHAQLAARCIRFLDCPEAWVASEGDCREFTYYAASFWFRHLRDAERCYDTVSDLVNSFMRPRNDNFESWKLFYERKYSSSNESSATSFYYACLFGLVPAMDFLHMHEDLDINSVGGQYGTPLQAVCTEGHIEAFERLLQWEADVTVHGGQFGNALNAAAYHGRITMVRALLDLGESTKFLSSEKRDAMGMAAGLGHVEIVLLFLNQGADMNSLGCIPVIGLDYATTPLHAATVYGQLGVVKVLLEQGADPTVADQYENTPLHYAAYDNLHEIMNLLLQHGANTSIRGRMGTPLHIAATHGHLNIVTQLVDYQAVLDAPEKNNRIPLHEAAVNGHAGVVSFFLEKDVSANARDGDDWTPLHFAASNGYCDLVMPLVQHGADVNAQSRAGYTALHCAVLGNHLEVAELLLEMGAAIKDDGYGWTPLHTAADDGQFDIVLCLIKHGADMNAQSHAGSTPLQLAIKKDHLEVTKLLLEKGAPIQANKYGRTPLHAAAQLAQLDITTLLLDRGADIDARDAMDRTPLHAAARNGENGVNERQRLEEVKLLLARGAAFAADIQGWDPLHVTAQHNYSQIIAFFLDQGRNIDARTIKGSTSLAIAISNDNLDAAELLISRGADVNISDTDGSFALSRAVQQDNLRYVQSLVERKCNVNAISVNRISPLHMAIATGTDEVVEYLIRSGADLSAMDCYGMTCSDWLKRSRPNFKVPRAMSQEFDAISFGPKMAVLKCTLIDLTTQIRKNKAKRLGNFYKLARCFFLLGMEDDARLAYQQRVLAQEGSSIHVPVCDKCRAHQNKVDPFFACKTCSDTDLCESCMDKYDKEEVLKYCRNHKFLRIVASEAKFQPSDNEAFDRWLDGIIEQFKDS